MLSVIRLEGCSEDKEELVRLDGGAMPMGREVEEGLALDLPSISRMHAKLFEINGQWFVGDQESTNGTYVNSIRLKPGAVKPLRSGDTMQLANFPMRVWVEREGTPGDDPLLTVFRQSQVEVEATLTQFDSFKIGGESAQISISGLEDQPPIAEIVRRGSEVKIFAHNLDIPVMLNGKLISEEMTLYDRDEVSIGPFHVFLSDYRSEAVAADKPSIFEMERETVPAVPPKFKPSARPMSFDRAMQLRDTGNFGTVSPNGPRVGEMTMSQRFAHTAQMKSIVQPEQEQRYVMVGIIVGVVVVGAIIFSLFIL